MTTTLYTTRELLAVTQHIDKPGAFFRDRYFGNRYNSTTEEVVFDRVSSRRRIAPLVAPVNPAKERAIRGSTSTSYAPPYVKLMNVLNPSDTIKRRPGEALPMDMSPEQRRDALILQVLEDQEDEITRREELMCSSIIQTGSLSLTGNPDHPDVSIDFDRAAGHTVTLTSGDRWGESGIDPLDSIEAWATTGSNNKGGVFTDVILGSSAASLFLKSTRLDNGLDNRRQAGGDMQFGGAYGNQPDQFAVYLGSLGQFNYWTYNQQFEDDSGSTVQVMPLYGVAMFAPAMMGGWMAYGAIQDMESLAAVDRFPKMFNENNPSRTCVMTQSAPLPLVERANSTFFALVR